MKELDELVEQYQNVKKWKKEMLAAMICMIVAGAALIAAGVLLQWLTVIFVVFGAAMCVIGAAIYLITVKSVNDATEMVRETLDNLNLTSERRAELDEKLGFTVKSSE